MPEAATTEFWRDIKPVPNSFKPGVLPEVYMKDPANSDPRYFVPVSDQRWFGERQVRLALMTWVSSRRSRKVRSVSFQSGAV